MEEMASGVNQLPSDTRTNEGSLRQYQDCRTIKLDQPPRQGDASFGAGQSTVEQIFICRLIIAKHLENQRNL